MCPIHAGLSRLSGFQALPQHFWSLKHISSPSAVHEMNNESLSVIESGRSAKAGKQQKAVLAHILLIPLHV